MRKENSTQGTTTQVPAPGNAPAPENQYKGLPRILHSVRWTQHLLAIVAEILILASFAMSGMDVSLGGVMTGVPWLKWAWGAAFALGIDTCFIIAWVRVRQCVANRTWGALVWNLILALGMSFIVFQPVAIQLLQQSLAINFNQALGALGINIVILVYARALVAVLLGAILAMTNVESAMKNEQVSTAQKPKRRLTVFDGLLNKYAPIVSDEQEPQPLKQSDTPAQSPTAQIVPAQLSAQEPQVLITEEVEQVPLKQIEPRKRSTPLRLVSTGDKLSMIEQGMYDAFMRNPEEGRELETLAQGQSIDAFTAMLQGRYREHARFITPERVTHVMSFIARERGNAEQVLNAEQSPLERVKQVLNEKPDCSDRELGRLSGLAPATAKKYRGQIEQEAQAVNE